MVQFVYRPKSGDRVFAQQHDDEIVVLSHPNRCRTVVGGVRLSYYAAQHGYHFRATATTMATALVKAVGGIAWDDQGIVSLIVPASSALRVDELMRAAMPAPKADVASPEPAHVSSAGNLARLVLAGYGLAPSLANVDSSVWRQPNEPRYCGYRITSVAVAGRESAPEFLPAIELFWHGCEDIPLVLRSKLGFLPPEGLAEVPAV